MTVKQKIEGTVGIAAHDSARFTEFAISCLQETLPPGWIAQSALNYDLARARNHLTQTFRGDKLLLLDDDHGWSPGLVYALARHNLDAVGALCLGRRAPFNPCPLALDGEPILGKRPPGLVEVERTGGAGLMLSRKALESLPWPPFAHGDSEDGTSEADDVHVCRLLREAGFSIYVDTRVILSHIFSARVFPQFEDGEWSRVLWLPNDVELELT